jgi:uncharacterized membrane protein YecN with MAPEG domain
MQIAIICTALLGLLVFGLGFAVSIARANSKTGSGHSQDPTDRLHKTVRAHGNTTEYAPMLAALFVYLGTQDPTAWVTGTMAVATASRYMIVAGILIAPSLDNANPLRFLGALGTYVTGIVLSIAALLTL